MNQMKKFGYTVIRKSDKKIMDDGMDGKKGNLIIIYPIFKTKKDCLEYAQNTYNSKNNVFRLRWFQGLEIVKVELVILPTKA